MLIDFNPESDIQATCHLLRCRRMRARLITIGLPAVRKLSIAITITNVSVCSDGAIDPNSFTTLRLSDDSIIPARHRELIECRILLHTPGIFPKQWNKSLIRVVIEVMHFISPRQQVSDRFRRWVIRDGAADDVGHVPMIFFLRQAQFGITVEAAEGREMDIAAENGDADGVFGR